MFEEIFAGKKIITEKLLEYGFEIKDGKYHYRTDILKNEYSLLVIIDENDRADTVLRSKDDNEEYVLYKTNAAGAYVGEVRAAIAEVLEDISLKCCKPSVFKAAQTLRVIDFVFDTYGDSLEFLWKKFPDNAVWRRKDTKKWYGAVLTVSRNKLGLDSNDQAEILDLRTPPENMGKLLKQENYYPGWHMNKKNWYTIILDESINDEKVFNLIRDSYELAVK